MESTKGACGILYHTALLWDAVVVCTQQLLQIFCIGGSGFVYTSMALLVALDSIIAVDVGLTIDNHSPWQLLASDI